MDAEMLNRSWREELRLLEQLPLMNIAKHIEKSGSRNGDFVQVFIDQPTKHNLVSLKERSITVLRDYHWFGSLLQLLRFPVATFLIGFAR